MLLKRMPERFSETIVVTDNANVASCRRKYDRVRSRKQYVADIIEIEKICVFVSFVPRKT